MVIDLKDRCPACGKNHLIYEVEDEKVVVTCKDCDAVQIIVENAVDDEEEIAFEIPLSGNSILCISKEAVDGYREDFKHANVMRVLESITEFFEENEEERKDTIVELETFIWDKLMVNDKRNSEEWLMYEQDEDEEDTEQENEYCRCNKCTKCEMELDKVIGSVHRAFVLLCEACTDLEDIQEKLKKS